MRALVLVALTGCFVASPVMKFGSGKSAGEAQHERVADLTPPPLAMERRWTGPVATATIRVYADEQFRAQNVEWRKAFQATLDYANAVLEPTYGVRLTPDFREWKHHAPAATLPEHLRELASLDTGKDVLCVVGMTSALGLVSDTFDMLGVAEIGGRHMILRGYANVAELQAFTAAFPKVPAEERANAVVGRRLHKTTTLLLHELGHNLGSPHDEIEDAIMSPQYSHRATAFTPNAHAVIQSTLDRRIGRAELTHTVAVLPASADAHGTMAVRIVKDGFIVDGRPYDDGELDIVMRTQAGIDAGIEVIVERDDGVPQARLTATVERLKALGLTHVTFK